VRHGRDVDQASEQGWEGAELTSRSLAQRRRGEEDEEETSRPELSPSDIWGAQSEAMSRNDEKWSRDVTQRSNALDLEQGVFTFSEPRRIAESLKRSAEQSSRRKGTPYQSAMSMLNFYINRAGRNLPMERRLVLERAKGELRELFTANDDDQPRIGHHRKKIASVPRKKGEREPSHLTGRNKTAATKRVTT
jgi:hypothetical protein